MRMAPRIPQAVPSTENSAVGGSAPDGAAYDCLKIEWAPLARMDLTAWIALRRVNEGGVALLEGSYYHHGRPVPEYLNAPFTELIGARYLMLADADPGAEIMQQVRFTQEGRQLYAELCGKRGVSPDPPVCVCPGTADQGYEEEGSRHRHGDPTTSGGRTGGFPDR